MSRFAALWVCLAMLAVGCGRGALERQLEESEQMRAAAERHVARYKQAAIAKDAYIVSVTTMLNQIADRIDLLRAEELALIRVTLAGESRGRLVDRNLEVPETLDRVRLKLGENRDQIELLEETLATADRSLVELVGMTQRLRAENEALEQRFGALRTRLAALSERVETLETEVVTLTAENTEKDVRLEERDAEIEKQREALDEAERALRRVSYRVDSVRNLRKEGVLRGWRARLDLDALNMSDAFVEADRGGLQAIDLGAERIKIRVLPERPPSSFRLAVRDGRTWLEILDPAAFWQVRIAVIAYKR